MAATVVLYNGIDAFDDTGLVYLASAFTYPTIES